jgi:hypothetical protein
MKTIFLFLTLVFFSLNLVPQNNDSYFDVANKSIKKYNPSRKDYVIVIDYSKSIFSERLFVLDIKTNKVVISSTVSHSFKSGMFYVNKYSNKKGSNMTCGGNFVTKGTKYGGFGYSMIIKGLDKGVNDNSETRSIIFHSTKKMKTKWSKGCFATPENINKQIIDLTKNGCLVCVIK